MTKEVLVERFFETLIRGDRNAARVIVAEAASQGAAAETIYNNLFWPTYELIERLHRADQMTALSYRLSTRLLRVLVDQTATRLSQSARNGQTVLAVCGPNDADELGAQMAVDLLEASGFEVTFAGGGVPADEVIQQIHEYTPNTLLLFASAPGDLPEIRSTIDTLHEIGACESLRIVVGGGVFNRAEGLADEIGADQWAECPEELVETMQSPAERRAVEAQRTVGKKRRAKAA